MKRLLILILLLPTMFVSQALCQASPYGKRNTKVFVASYKDNWYPIVGAKGYSPIILTGEGKTKKLSRSAAISYSEGRMSVGGEIEILDSSSQTDRIDGIQTSLRMYRIVSEEDIDDLYFVILLRPSGSQNVSAIMVKEIGDLEAGKPKSVSFRYSPMEETSNPLTTYYTGGLEVRARTVKSK